MTRINVYTNDEYEGKIMVGWFNPDKAVESVEENTERDGNNMVSVVTSRYDHEHLYRTTGGRWVLNHWSQWVGVEETYTFIADDQAKDWLLRNHSDDVAARWFKEIPEEFGPGRPEVGGAVHVRLGEDLLARVNVWGACHGITRAEAIRHLLDAAMQADPIKVGA
jgi:hypothetical protein